MFTAGMRPLKKLKPWLCKEKIIRVLTDYNGWFTSFLHLLHLDSQPCRWLSLDEQTEHLMPPSVLPRSEGKETIYHIVIEGHLDSALVPFLNGLDISCTSEEETNISILNGELPDQSALAGVLDVLINHRYTLLSVKRIRNTINY